MTSANPVTLPLSGYTPRHFHLAVAGKVATVTLNRPEKKNPLTFESYRELTDFFLAAQKEEAVKAIVVTGAGGNFSSGGDVFEIIGPLVAMETRDLLKFTRMTGDLVKTMRACPQPVIAAIDGICAGAGAIIAMASDLRLGTAETKIAFLFNRVGLAGCDMGACAMLPRIVGQGAPPSCSTPAGCSRARRPSAGASSTASSAARACSPRRRRSPPSSPTGRPSPTP